MPYAYIPPERRRDCVVAAKVMLSCREPAERRALFAHERAHLVARHRRLPPTVRPRAIGRAALVSVASPVATLAGFEASRPVPRRVAALLGPAPAVADGRRRSPRWGRQAWGAAVSVRSSAASAGTVALIPYAATPL
ncbi:hypothetical protein OG889_41255 [Streptomyces sp. NBC_00481]|uniref:M48 family metalloprotease n=1 Tax=unclassified Streptomyces TaxID=2593676 RepID=UPI002DDBDFD8|nr:MULTISPECIES: M48 family metalloprotease [unclassified Streptomyces]WRZ00548.1 hypothetical protein OG889_41255 [Streptomyces sp. NBC_00481]